MERFSELPTSQTVDHGPRPEPSFPFRNPRVRSAATLVRLLPLLLTTFGLAACVASGASSSQGRSTDPVIHEELAAVHVTDAFQALQRLRPGWLRSRGPVSLRHPEAGFPVVYVDAVRHGNVETLRQIQVASVRQIEFIGSGEATARYGTGHPSGVILVSTRP